MRKLLWHAYYSVLFLLLVFTADAAITKLRNVSVQLGASGTPLTGTVGNSGLVQQANSVSANSGYLLCTDGSANSNNGNTACGVTLVSTGKLTSGICSTGNASPHTCGNTVSISPTQPDTNYMPSCFGVGPSGSPFIAYVSKANNSITAYISNGTADQGVTSTFSEIDCMAVHP
jgi:hypothetical protein